MLVSIDRLCVGEVCDLSIELPVQGCTTLFDAQEFRSAAILHCLVDTDAIASGGITIDSLPIQDFYQKHTITETFGYVFDEGIMLSNLSIQENLRLPYRMRFPSFDESNFIEAIRSHLDLFDLKLDLNQRPAFVKPSVLKQLCLIRSMILQPKALLIDNPLYLLNRMERLKLVQILEKIKQRTPMIIASTDMEFAPPFADNFLVWDAVKQFFYKSSAIS